LPSQRLAVSVAFLFLGTSKPNDTTHQTARSNSGFLFAMIEGGVEDKRRELRTVALLTAATSALGLMLPKLIAVDAWPLFLALGFLTLFWAGYSFVKFGKRGWWVLALALP